MTSRNSADIDKKALTNFFYEAGQLKRVKRSGWWLEGVDNPESVADHSFRAGIIAYFIAKIEGADAEKAMLMGLFNDIHEARINDLHKLAQRYIDIKPAEKIALDEQLSALGEPGKELKELLMQFLEQATKEALIAKDADYLEDAIQAKEYMEIGHKTAVEHIKNIRKLLKFESSKKILEIVETNDSHEWFRELKKIER